MSPLRKLPLLVACLGLLLGAAPSVHADGSGIVTIIDTKGGIRLTGRILAADDRTLTLQSAIGEVRLPLDRVTCEGAPCPAPGAQAGVQPGTDADTSLAGLAQALMERRSRGIASPEPGGAGTTVTKATVSIRTDQSTHRSAARALAMTKRDAVPAGQIIALDALVPVVHPSNPIRALSLPELAAIASGNLTNWAELGGEDRDIRLRLPPATSPQATLLRDRVLRPSGLYPAPDAWGLATTDIPEWLRNSPDGIAFVSLAQTDGLRTVPIRQVCGPLIGATPFAIKSEEYPLTHRIILETPQDGAANEPFHSPEARQIIRAHGLVDTSILTAPIDAQGGRMSAAVLSAESGVALGEIQTFARTLVGADRLSTTFRFAPGGQDLDQWAQQDVAQVAAFLADPSVAARGILVLGFTDGTGRYDLNARIAEEAAQQVRAALLDTPHGPRLVDRITVDTYGPLAPVGCNETAQGRRANHRVEIWLK